jgi:phosphoribosylamine--glycine ligase
VRFGDPETQPIMLRLNSDLVDLVEAALEGDVTAVRAEWDARPSLGVVLAAGGYPGKVRAGDVIQGADADFGADVKVFHAGTALDADGKAVTAGGRVLTVCAVGDDLVAARAAAYAAVEKVRFEGVFYRRDIAHRAFARR